MESKKRPVISGLHWEKSQILRSIQGKTGRNFRLVAISSRSPPPPSTSPTRRVAWRGVAGGRRPHSRLPQNLRASNLVDAATVANPSKPPAKRAGERLPRHPPRAVLGAPQGSAPRCRNKVRNRSGQQFHQHPDEQTQLNAPERGPNQHMGLAHADQMHD